MIKLNTLNIFDDFNPEANRFQNGESEGSNYDFTGMLNGFSFEKKETSKLPEKSEADSLNGARSQAAESGSTAEISESSSETDFSGQRTSVENSLLIGVNGRDLSIQRSKNGFASLLTDMKNEFPVQGHFGGGKDPDWFLTEILDVKPYEQIDVTEFDSENESSSLLLEINGPLVQKSSTNVPGSREAFTSNLHSGFPNEIFPEKRGQIRFDLGMDKRKEDLNPAPADKLEIGKQDPGVQVKIDRENILDIPKMSPKPVNSNLQEADSILNFGNVEIIEASEHLKQKVIANGIDGSQISFRSPDQPDSRASPESLHAAGEPAKTQFSGLGRFEDLHAEISGKSDALDDKIVEFRDSQTGVHDEKLRSEDQRQTQKFSNNFVNGEMGSGFTDYSVPIGEIKSDSFEIINFPEEQTPPLLRSENEIFYKDLLRSADNETEIIGFDRSGSDSNKTNDVKPGQMIETLNIDPKPILTLSNTPELPGQILESIKPKTNEVLDPATTADALAATPGHTNSLTRLFLRIARIFRDERVPVSNSGPVGFSTQDQQVVGGAAVTDNAAMISDQNEDSKPIGDLLKADIPDGIQTEKGDRNTSPDLKPSNEDKLSASEIADSLQTGELTDYERSAVKAIEQKDGTEIKLGTLELQIPKPDNEPPGSREFRGLNFEGLRWPTTKDLKADNNRALSMAEKQIIIKQIEPQIIEKARFVNINEEKQLLKLRLNPAELGGVEVSLERDAGGNISARFQASTETARNILIESLGQLRDSLQNSGLKVDNLEVSSDLAASNGNQNRDQQSRQAEQVENGGDFVTRNDANLENEDASLDIPAQRLVNLQA